MRARINCSGSTPREAKIVDAKRILAYDFKHDTAYAENVYYWINGKDPKDGEHLDIKFYDIKYSSANGKTKAFQTKIDDLIVNGTCIHDMSDDTHWICKEDTFNVDDIHCKGTFTKCNYLLSWQNNEGDIVYYWCKTQNASSYSTGTEGNSTITIGSDQLMIILPFDDETKQLKRDKRFMIMADGCEPVCYKLTRPDTTTYMDNGVGCICLIVSESSDYNVEKDNKDLKICDYITPTTPSQPIYPDENTDETVVSITSTISGNNTLKVGFPRIYSVIFMDKNSTELSDVDFSWNIASDFNDKITSTINGQSITLQIDEEDYVNEQISLQVITNDTVNSEIILTITGQF